MELDDLKGAWNKYSLQSNIDQVIPASAFEIMIGKRTTDITKKIGRNIRIGIGIVLAWAVIGVTIDFAFTPLLERLLDKPYMTDRLIIAVFGVEMLNYIFIFSALFIFGYRFNKIEREPIDRFDLRITLTNYIRILDAYRKMFYVILTLVLIYAIASFSTGFVLEYTYQMKLTGKEVGDISSVEWLIIVFSFVFTAGVIVGVYYLLFTLFFKRLYGKYLVLLKSTLRELNESYSAETE